MTDRALQDDLIRALADPAYRRSPTWRDRGLADPVRVERFARFLARRYYHERVLHFFKYSRFLARVTGRAPADALRTAEFDRLLPELILGDRSCAARVAALVVAHVGAAGSAVPYLADLLRYEEAMMVAEAGPRAWGDADVVAEESFPLELDHDLPAVLPALLRPFDVVPEAPARPCRLVITRSPHARITVTLAEEAEEVPVSGRAP